MVDQTKIKKCSEFECPPVGGTFFSLILGAHAPFFSFMTILKPVVFLMYPAVEALDGKVTERVSAMLAVVGASGKVIVGLTAGCLVSLGFFIVGLATFIRFVFHYGI